MEDEKRIIRTPCTVAGHRDNWVEFDCTKWSGYEFRMIPEASLDSTIGRWVETDSTDWHITDEDDQKIPHPGRGAELDDWLEVYRRVPIYLCRWLSMTPYIALREVGATSKKRTDGGADDGPPAG